MSMKKDVVCAFTNNISYTHELKKCWLETLPAFLCHITFMGGDNMAICKLLGKLLHLRTQQDFISDLFFFLMQTNEDRAGLWSTGCQPVIDTSESWEYKWIFWNCAFELQFTPQCCLISYLIYEVLNCQIYGIQFFFNLNIWFTVRLKVNFVLVNGWKRLRLGTLLMCRKAAHCWCAGRQHITFCVSFSHWCLFLDHDFISHCDE